jgi:hypothetical protein
VEDRHARQVGVRSDRVERFQSRTCAGQQDIRTVIEDMLNAVVAGNVTDIPAAVKAAGAKANQILKDNQ